MALFRSIIRGEQIADSPRHHPPAELSAKAAISEPRHYATCQNECMHIEFRSIIYMEAQICFWAVCGCVLQEPASTFTFAHTCMKETATVTAGTRLQWPSIPRIAWMLIRLLTHAHGEDPVVTNVHSCWLRDLQNIHLMREHDPNDT